jgi:probable selenium-dependent hydroxylase accessory protein YqeC
MREFCEFFGIGKGITALIGGGGKTSTMYALAGYLRSIGSVIVCTSTHIMSPPQFPFRKQIDVPLKAGEVVSTGSIDGIKLSSPEQSFDELIDLADYVLVEADGSRQLPLKAHAAHEPVIPKESSTVLVLVGIDGLGKPIRYAAHRPELFAKICHASVDDPVNEEMIRCVLSTYPKYDGVVINKADDASLVNKALSLAEILNDPAVITAWHSNDPIKAYRRNKR